jgi:hypothetical protein
MVKSLLLGSAAALVAVAGAQAADMPVKAAPVQYVKICTLYGDGFYYIPGTDTCLKMGGYVRVQVETKAGGGGIADGTLGQVVQARYTRGHTNDYDYRVRGAISWDVRQQTAYGTLRTYIRTGVNQTTPADGPGGSVFWDRAFIQFAGFTIGKAQSFYDTVTYGGAYSYHNVRTVSDTGASGWNVWAYTAQFGNGWSGTLSLEDPNRGKFIVDTSATDFFSLGGGLLVPDNAFTGCNNGAALFASGTTRGYQTPGGCNGFRTPDVVAQVRWDQAWGYIAASAALHDASATYWGTIPGAGSSPAAVDGAGGGQTIDGHPPDAFGYAFSLGGLFNIPGGHKFGVNGQWSVGASGYGAAPFVNWGVWNSSSSVGAGWAPDGVVDIGLEIEKTTVWNVIAFYEHVWSPQWKTSFFGGYVQVEYSDAAKNIILSRVSNGTHVGGGSFAFNGEVCGVAPSQFGGFNTTHFFLLPGNSCDPDFSFWQVGTRTQWNPVPQLDIGLEFLYTRVNTAFAGPAVFTNRDERVGNGAISLANQEATDITHAMEFDDQNIFSVLMRWQRNFYP